MSVSLMALVFNCNMPELKTDDGKTVPDTTAKFVLLALADNANEEGEGAYPGVDTLCAKTNFSTSTVCNALNALRHNGFTSLVGRSKRDTNNYTVSVAEIMKFQRLKSQDSSHRNGSVSTAETNPSLTTNKPPVNYIEPVAKKLADNNFKFDPKLPFFIEQWKHDFPDQDNIIIRAIDDAIVRSKKSVAYVDAILAGWKVNGVPPTREEKARQNLQRPQKQSLADLQNSLMQWAGEGAD